MGYVDFLYHNKPEALWNEHGGNIYEVKRRYNKEVIDFSANINPLGLPKTVKMAMYKNFNKILHYPDPETRDITRKIAKYWGINEQNILLGNGSVELIYLIVLAFKPKTTLIPVPTFSEYERAAKSIKSKVEFLKLKEKEDFRISSSGQTRADIAFICNPNNPTANFILKDQKIIQQLANRLIVVDEAFMDFVPDQKDHTLICRAINCKKIAVLRTFTKFFALPGLRIGYVVAHQEIINRLKQYQPPWSTNALSQIAAEMILGNREYIKKTYKLIEKERGFLYKQIARINGLKPYPSVTNFLLIRIKNSSITSKSLKESLIKKGILIRDCRNFRNLNHKYIRVAIRTRKENLKLLSALRSVL